MTRRPDMTRHIRSRRWAALAIFVVAAIVVAVWIGARSRQRESRLPGPGVRVVEKLVKHRYINVTRVNCAPARFSGGWNYACDYYVKGDPIANGVRLRVNASGQILAAEGAG